ncbi:MAG: class I mannose-6-phosphate isomerase [Planctomycetes bacterium]|nr:class I mannose-6-phosphate isomerase [Planctomycetota bacterium]MCW8135810.1 class I mannose-6-phosphate isomerase [Planctomycetota bacterium]
MYPLRLHRVCVPKPWAGDRLHKLFPDQAADVPVGTGEWIELDGNSIVANGDWKDESLPHLLRTRRQALIGALPPGPGDFPVCVKLLDSASPLSIQVHPSDRRESGSLVARGKCECWLVLDAARDAVIWQGLKAGVTPAQFKSALAGGDPAAMLNPRAVKPGDFLYNPAGMIHAIGGGLALLEVQQNCAVTYRLWDFPGSGKREMHIEQGLRAAKFDLPLPPVLPTHGNDVTLVRDGPFGVRSLRLASAMHEARDWPGFTVHTCLQGECEITGRGQDQLQPAILKPGETVLWPAVFDQFEYYPRGECWLIACWANQ